MAGGNIRFRQDSSSEVPAKPRPAWWATLAWVAVPVVAALLVYLNALGGDFVYDDTEQIVNNPWVHELKYLPNTLLRPVWAYKTARPTNYYRPVQMGLYNLLWVAFAKSPLPFHLLSVLFHLLNTTALFFLVRKATREEPMAAAAALLFAVHPLNTEAVAWIACLPELIYAFFLLAALLLHISSWSGERRRRVLLRGLSIFSFVLALFSKETAITLLLLIVPLELWIRPRLGGAPEGTASPTAGAGGWGGLRSRFLPAERLVRTLVPYALSALAYLAVRVAVVGGLAPRSRTDVTSLDAVINAPVLLLSYLRAMLLPTRLLAYHLLDRVPSLLHPRFLGSVLGLILLGGILLRLARRRPDLAFAGTLALLPLLPVLYLPAVGENAFAERYAYLPTAGIAWIVAGAAATGVQSIRGGRRSPVGLLAIAAVLALPSAARTVLRNADWRDDVRLATATLREEPRAWHMHVVLAGWHQRHGRKEEALNVLERGLAAFPENAVLQAAVIDARVQTHRISPEEAVRELRSIVDRRPDLYEAQYNFGVACLNNQRPADAEAAFRRAVEINPHGIQAHEGLFMALVAQGKAADWNEVRGGLPSPPALRSADKMFEGIAEAKAGRLDEARAALEEARRLDPASERVLLALAMVADKRGEDRAAMDYCRQAIALKPDSEPAYEQLGASALKIGEVAEAVSALERAVSIDANNKQAFSRLGVAYAQAGRPDEARAAFEKALAIDPDFDKARFNLDALNRRMKQGAGE